ncbi:unnamed protein product [Notodromas monacha]|uniref:Uncharacterized protein n=1 Tax=Notodromas monacha TaxID=399045 RepID=A0A7R9BSK4_9CRUS|nr:unnamed protein product [Notodromas monacha]CAG0920960.1 unnamed protein product [Notodromas monacha]
MPLSHGHAPSRHSISTIGTQSLHSLYSTRSSRTVKSSKLDKWKRPLIDPDIFDLQKGAWIMGLFSLFLSMFTVATAIFDIYCLAMAEPGTSHYGYYIISFEFVYAGNPNVRNSLIVFALFSLLLGAALFVTTVILLAALRKEEELKMIPWLFCMLGFIGWRLFATMYASVVNDMIFSYHRTMCVLWVLFILASAVGWIVVYSQHMDLRDLTRLEDVAKLKRSTISSLNTSYANQSISLSIAGSVPSSRPITPRDVTPQTSQPPAHNVSMSTDIM